MTDQALPSAVTVCVLIPMYNAADCIEQTLASLIEQTRLPDHVIVVDDGSTDNGPELVRNFVAPFRLTLLHQANEGQASARNHGLRYSQETYVALLDADDPWHPQKLEKQLALFEKLTLEGHPVGLVDCNVLIEYSNGTRQVEARYKNGRHFFDFIHANIVNGVSAALVKREVLVELGGFDASLRYSEDRDMWTRIAEHWEIHTVPEILMRRAINSGNITSQPKKYYAHKMRFIDLYLARYSKLLTREQQIDFVLGNHKEFLYSFSRGGAHAEAIDAYRRMFEYSWQTLFFDHGKPTLRYLYARLKTWGKVAESTTAQ
jgi:glycosyltransferase involved in cell wall biosynthesis